MQQITVGNCRFVVHTGGQLHPSHVKNSIPFSQFLRLQRLCNDDSDFPKKSEQIRHFFKKHGYPDSVVNTAGAQQIDRQSALQTSQGNTESRKNLEQKSIFQIGTLNPHGINERFSLN